MQVENARRGSYITGGGGAAADVVGARRSCPCRNALPPLALQPSPSPIDGSSTTRPRNTSAVRIEGGERKTR